MVKIKKFLLDNYNIITFLIKNVLFAILLLTTLNFFNIANINLLLNIKALLYTSFLLFFLLFWLFFEKKGDQKQWEKIFQYLFLTSLSLVFFANLDFNIIKEIALLNYLKDTTLLIENYLILITIFSGFFTFYFGYEKIEKDLRKEKTEEEFKEKKRSIEFSKKFTKTNKIPIFKNILRWMYKEGWAYSISVILLIFIGFGIRLYNLGELGLWWDEGRTGTYVTRILETGKPLEPSGLQYYWRGVAYHYFLALFAFVFNNSEFWLRFPGVLFGMGIITSAFCFARNINKKVAFLVLIFLVFSTYNIEYSRFARFYIMNTFLLMIVLYFFWEGFFKEKLKYKILSLLTFFLMLHTVQFGLIFLALIPTWLIFLIKKITHNFSNITNILKDNMVNFALLSFSIPIYLLGNIPNRLFKIEHEYPLARDVIDEVAQKRREWSHLQTPEWELISFFYNEYTSLVIIVIIYLFFVAVFSFLSNKKNSFISYLAVFTLFSIMLYEIGSRGVTGARIYFFIEALLAIFLVLAIYHIAKLILHHPQKQLFLTSAVILLVFLSIKPYFTERISIDYGNSVVHDNFRTTPVAKFRADNKTTNEYVTKNKNDEDIIIVVMSTNYYYLKEPADYILNQNYRWNSNSFIKNEQFISRSTGSTLINSVEDLTNIIQKENKVWLVVNGASTDVLKTTHVRNDFIRFLETNRDKIVYESEDERSVVLLFRSQTLEQ